ncbi:two-component system sensor histidine kinase NtrB [Pseudalkalibacillus caeni]|uniref:two-component system sensor histidine kinase NtrB n=1 Tax=Exobacillus caeni TaxID=2574798 RepID=UPI0014850197|nr:ATP-binding protein [Pseudalkalibacillus caeni]
MEKGGILITKEVGTLQVWKENERTRNNTSGENRLFSKNIVKLENAVSKNCFSFNGHISADLAHEIKNPLTIIRGFIQLIKPDLEQLNKKEIGELLLNEIDRAKSLIEGCLQTSFTVNQKTEEVDLNEFLNEIILLFQVEASKRNISLTQTLTDKPSCPSTYINRNELKQVLINLIKNAMEAIEETKRETEGRISITASNKNDGSVTIQVSDNGKGMDERTAANLFEPFFTTKQDGTGLGLCISRRIINQYNGKLSVKSSYGEGTTFQINLPGSF